LAAAAGLHREETSAETVQTLLAPFFAWKKQSGRKRFDAKSQTKYEQYLLPFAAWAGDRLVLDHRRSARAPV
jgi:hypothetical protein